jgi:hypothetical protein
MNKERLNDLLIKAINMLIDEDIMNVEIKENIGATDEEWEDLMDSF